MARIFFAVRKSAKLARLISRHSFFFRSSVIVTSLLGDESEKICRIYWERKKWRHTLRSYQRKRVINKKQSEWKSRVQKHITAKLKTHFCLWSIQPLFQPPFINTAASSFCLFLLCVSAPSTEFSFNFFLLFYLCVAFIFLHHNLFEFFFCHSFSCRWIIYSIFFLLCFCLIIYDVLLINILIWCCYVFQLSSDLCVCSFFVSFTFGSFEITISWHFYFYFA